MAYVGLRYPVFAPIKTETPGSPITYDNGVILGKLRNCTVSFERANAEMYADDALVESENSIIGGTTSFEVDNMTDEIKSALFGLKKSESDEYTDISKTAPYGGFGYVRGITKGGVPSYEAYFIYKVQHSTGDETANTKEASTNFEGVTVSGKMAGVTIDNSGDICWRVHKSFDTFEAAKTWLNGKANITNS